MAEVASTILVIDDSVDIHRLLKIRLRDQNVAISSSSSGQDGIERARELLPDLILLDIDMPGMSGFEVLAELKHDPLTVEIPVIFLSGSGGSTNKVKGFDLGAVDFVTKPFDIAELRARVRSALRTRKLVKMLAQRAQVDGLTGLWNRTHLDEQLVCQVSQARRHDTPLALIMSDVDKFKNLNDTHGHPFGDQVLQEVANILVEETRDSDISCRYGGEEFAVILPMTSLADAVTVAERCRQTLEAYVWASHDDLCVTASFGVTDLGTAEEPTAASVIKSADAALYAAKHGGRNRVVRADEEHSTRGDCSSSGGGGAASESPAQPHHGSSSAA
ncbi:MAG: diguanylate cyclase [Planctomycetes bacterium]|nr:diguanylate cyclase [Planctomycetota bacterium]NOG54625.1 diguanylate cyclase [Planctomycetota bacterium]